LLEVRCEFQPLSGRHHESGGDLLSVTKVSDSWFQFPGILLPLTGSAAAMPITSYLGDTNVDRETHRVMGLAFEMTCAALRVDDDKLRRVIAHKIIELAKTGERNPNELCERALIEIRAGK
jgi:hypothetical protein